MRRQWRRLARSLQQKDKHSLHCGLLCISLDWLADVSHPTVAASLGARTAGAEVNPILCTYLEVTPELWGLGGRDSLLVQGHIIKPIRGDWIL